MMSTAVISVILVVILLIFNSNGHFTKRKGYVKLDKSLEDEVWSERAKSAWNILKTAPCKKIQYGDNCTTIWNKERKDMLIYTASADEGKLATVFVEKVKGRIRRHNAVLVIDPFPEAHFGHTVIVFLIDYFVRRAYCRRKAGEFIKVGKHQECLYISQSETCRNRIDHGRKGRRRCEINFLPLVYNAGDSKFTQRLTCRSNFENFGQCPPVISALNDRCSNSGRCSSSSTIRSFGRFRWLCLEKCDHAVLISGGWNSLMNKPRHLENLKATWLYLKSKGFLERNMKIFFANNETVDIDNNKKTRDTIPATESSGILKYIESVCTLGPHCVDSLTIYLNGPTLMNGNLLLWDRNGDGIADGTEMLRVREFLNRLEGCNVSWITIIADQNYAGHLVESIWERYAQSKPGSAFRKISVYAASNKRSYTWHRDFTETWIQQDTIFESGIRKPARKLSSIFKDVKKSLSNKFHFSDFSAPRGTLRTINGKLGEEEGCTLNQPWDISAQLFRFPRRAARYPEEEHTESKSRSKRNPKLDKGLLKSGKPNIPVRSTT